MIVILSKDALVQFLTTHFKSGTVYHDLENGNVLLSGEHKDPGTQDEVLAHPEAFPLPDVEEIGQVISDQHVQHLQHFGIKKGFNTFQVRKEIRKIRKNF